MFVGFELFFEKGIELEMHFGCVYNSVCTYNSSIQ